MSGEFWPDDRQWRRLAPLLPNKPRGVPRVDGRRVISGIIHVQRSGCRWVDALIVYGPRKTLYNRFVRWAAKGVWQAVFEALAAESGPPAELLLDSIHVKAHRRAAGGKGGSAPKGTVRNSVFGRSVERHRQARALVKRWPKITANWALAMAHSRGGMVHSFSVLFKTR